MNKELQDLLENNPAIWRASDRGTTIPRGVTTGYPELDAILPGRGWPKNALVEMIAPRWGVGEMQLLLPLMKSATQDGRWVLLISPPFVPYAPALASAGVDINRVVVVRADSSCKDALWSIEKALQNSACAMVLAWSNWMPNGMVRRLQLAAEAGKTLGILFRQFEMKNSPVSIRLEISPSFEGVRVKTLKARGTHHYHTAHLNLHEPFRKYATLTCFHG